MKRLILAAALTALFMTGAVARPTPGQQAQLSPAELKQFRVWQASQPGAVAKPAPAVDPPPVALPVPAPVVAPVAPAVVAPPAPVAAPAPAASSPVTVSSGPGGETTISIGTIAGQALNWILITFSVPLGTYAIIILQRVFTNLKIPMTNASRAKLKEIIVNGLNLAAPAIQAQLAGQGNVAIKNATIAQAVVYAQQHGADSIKALGLDPTSPQAVEAIKAWAETAIADPAVPTAPVLDPAKPAVVDPAAPAKAA